MTLYFENPDSTAHTYGPDPGVEVWEIELESVECGALEDPCCEGDNTFKLVRWHDPIYLFQ